MGQHERRFVFAIKIAGELDHADTTGAVHNVQMAARRSTKAILREAKMVPEFTLPRLRHTRHLNRRRTPIS